MLDFLVESTRWVFLGRGAIFGDLRRKVKLFHPLRELLGDSREVGDFVRLVVASDVKGVLLRGVRDDTPDLEGGRPSSLKLHDLAEWYFADVVLGCDDGGSFIVNLFFGVSGGHQVVNSKVA